MSNIETIKTKEQRLKFWLAMSLVPVLALLPVEAFAQDTITPVICIIVNIVDGNLGKALGSLAIAILGVTLLFGRASWMQALVIATGIAVVTGAVGIAAMLAGAGPC